jgi:hypothetical protein
MFLSCVEAAAAVFDNPGSATEQRVAVLQALAAGSDLDAPEAVTNKILAVLRRTGSNTDVAVRSAAAAVAQRLLQHGEGGVVGTANGYWLPGLLLDAVELAAPEHVLQAAVQHAIAACEQQQCSVSVDTTLRAMAVLVQQTALPVAAAWRAAHCAAVLLLKHSDDNAVHTAAHAVVAALGRRSDFWHSLSSTADAAQSLVTVDTFSSSSSGSSSKIQELTAADNSTNSAASCESESAGLQALLDFIQQCAAVSSSNSYATDTVLAEWTSTSTAVATLQVTLLIGKYHETL